MTICPLWVTETLSPVTHLTPDCASVDLLEMREDHLRVDASLDAELPS